MIEIAGIVQGEPVHGDTGWRQRVKHLGFVHASVLEPVEVEDS